jgi:hypothetical protein
MELITHYLPNQNDKAETTKKTPADTSSVHYRAPAQNSAQAAQLYRT